MTIYFNGQEASGKSLSVASGETLYIPSKKHLDYTTAHDSYLTINGTLKVDGSFLFQDLGS